MVRKASYRILSLVILVAFCQMLCVKQFHHHAHIPSPYEGWVCVLDGEDLSSHSGHHHSSLLPYFFSGDDNCPICHFNIFSLQRYTGQSVSFFSLPGTRIQTIPVLSIPTRFVGLSQSRAPPVV